MTTTSPLGKTALWVVIGILGVSGVAGAFIAIFGLFDSIAYSFLWRVFVADLYLLASLTSKHIWLRRTTWIAICVAFLTGLANAFWKFTPYYEWSDGEDLYILGDQSSGWSPWFDILDDLEYAAHIMVITLIMLCFLSNAYRLLRENRALKNIYIATFGLTLILGIVGAATAIDSSHRWAVFNDSGPLMSGLAILVLTGTAIVIISAFVFRSGANGKSGRATNRREPAHSLPAMSTEFSSAVGPTQPTQSTLTQHGIPALSEAELRLLIREVVTEVLAEQKNEAAPIGPAPST